MRDARVEGRRRLFGEASEQRERSLAVAASYVNGEPANWFNTLPPRAGRKGILEPTSTFLNGSRLAVKRFKRNVWELHLSAWVTILLPV